MNFTQTKNEESFDWVSSKRVHADAERDHGPTLEDRLINAGVPEMVLGDVVEEVERAAKVEAFHIAARTLEVIGRRLCAYSLSSAAVACALGIHGTNNSFESIASELGVSKQALKQATDRLAPMFSAMHLPPRPMVNTRPTEKGRWLTKAEAVREFKKGVASLISSGCRSVICGNRMFFDANDILRAQHDRDIAKAKARQGQTKVRKQLPTAWEERAAERAAQSLPQKTAA